MRTSSTDSLRRRRQAVFTRLGFFVLAAALVMPGAFSIGNIAWAQGQVAPLSRVHTGALEFAPDAVLVGMKPGGDVQGAALRLLGVKVPETADLPAAEAVFPEVVEGGPGQAGMTLPVQARERLGRVYRLRLPAGSGVLQAVEALRLDPEVEFVEPDYQAQLIKTPSDPLFGSQWGLGKIAAPAAWDTSTGDSGVTIALIDSGIDLSHPDLAGRLWANPGETAGNHLDDDGNGKVDDVYGWNFLAGNGAVDDENGHGTQVAGVVGAKTDNSAGVAGMCWGCRLMILKVVQASGVVNYSDIAAAVSYAASEGAQVINLSLGGYADSETLRTAVESATATAVVVGGAGNDGQSSPFYPAAYPGVIAVAATDQNDAKANFSNYGEWIDLTAPGVDIQTTLAGNSGYGAQSGTSLAAPFASGLAGLLRSSHPNWSPALVKQQILNTAVSIASQNPGLAGKLGSGRVAAGAAMATPPGEQMSIVEKAVAGQPGGLPAPGQTFDLVLTLENEWLPARSLVGTLTENDPYATIGDSQGVFGDVNTGQQASDGGDPFEVTLAGDTPYGHPIPFNLQLAGSDGYNLTLSFTISVRSGTYEISGEVCDETWTSDRNYVLKGSTIVSTGCTLAIEPGVQVRANAGIWMRVDGTLVVDGTAEAPVVFTTNAADGAKWAGLRFVDSSGAAVFDGEGNYVSGSLLRHVQLSKAETGVSMLTRAPYIVHSSFENNTTAVTTGTSGPRLEDNTFEKNDYAVQLGNGPVFIRRNRFVEGQYGVSNNMYSSSGSLIIHENEFTDTKSYAIYLQTDASGSPEVKGNRIVDSGGVYISGPQRVEFERNLVVGTSGASCTMPPCPGDPNPSAVYISVGHYDPATASGSVRYNTIVHNPSKGIHIGGSGSGNVIFSDNNWFDNGDYDIYLSTPTGVNVTLDNNYWGGLAANQAEGRIFDCGDTEDGCSGSATVGNATVASVLAAPDPTAPAFVQSVTVDPDPLGIQQGGFDITFSKAMDISLLPSLSFHDARKGTSETISAVDQFVSKLTVDAYGRVWVGTNEGAKSYDGVGWTAYNTENSGLSFNPIAGIFGASNGDVWFTTNSAPIEGNLINRLQGTEWKRYVVPPVCMMSNAIGEDAQGNIWFGTFCGVGRLVGEDWRMFTIEDGLLSNEIRGIARDGQGRMWFSHSNGLSVFDGAKWTQYKVGSDLPKYHSPGDLFTDQQGNIWVGLSYGPEVTGNYSYAGMFDGLAWTFYNQSNTNGLLNYPVSGFTASSKGEIWLISYWFPSYIVVFDGIAWSTQPVPGNNSSHMVFDLRDNLWMGSNMAGSSHLQVLWGGEDFPVLDNGEWISPNQFRATYDLTPIVPKGNYAVWVEGAAGTDRMLIAPDNSGTFLVDYAGTVVDSTPPSRPSVAITASSTGSLSFGWNSSDEQGILQYRYCVGTAAGRCDVLGWTYVPQGTTSVSLTGLLLAKGKTYYVTVAAQNTSGLWSAAGSGWVTIGQVRIYLPMTRGKP